MIKIKLTADQYEELVNLDEGETFEFEYKGLGAYITPDEFGNFEYDGRKYTFNFFAPTQIQLQVEKKEKKEKKITFLGATFDPKKMHVYDVKTKGKHPVHLIEGGEYITEDERDFEPDGDMGWYWLNEKEYQYYKSQLREITICE